MERFLLSFGGPRIPTITLNSSHRAFREVTLYLLLLPCKAPDAPTLRPVSRFHFACFRVAGSEGPVAPLDKQPCRGRLTLPFILHILTLDNCISYKIAPVVAGDLGDLGLVLASSFPVLGFISVSSRAKIQKL